MIYLQISNLIKVLLCMFLVSASPKKTFRPFRWAEEGYSINIYIYITCTRIHHQRMVEVTYPLWILWKAHVEWFIETVFPLLMSLDLL